MSLLRRRRASPRWQDVVTLVVTLASAVDLGLLLIPLGAGDSHASLIMVLAVMIISRYTSGYLYGVIASAFGVLVVNYAFMPPYFGLKLDVAGYPLALATMLGVSVMISALTSHVKAQEELRVQAERERLRANLMRAVGHDLRTPLTSIMGSASVILENEDSLSPQEKRKLLANIQSESEWMRNMVENLLSITQVGGDCKHIHKEPEGVEEIVGEVCQKFSKRYPAPRVEPQVPDNWLEVPMDAMLIEQVLFNLMENAVLHGKADLIRLQVCRRGGWAWFSVQDNGTGISEERMSHLYDGYMHLADTGGGDQRRNSGIGLLVCRDIIKVHGGELMVANRPSGGTEFYFTLPLEE